MISTFRLKYFLLRPHFYYKEIPRKTILEKKSSIFRFFTKKITFESLFIIKKVTKIKIIIHIKIFFNNTNIFYNTLKIFS